MKRSPKAYSYIRFSSAPQEKGDSLRRQVEYSERYAKKHGLVLDTTLHLRDLGLSAFDGSNVDRGALGGFLQAINDGRIDKGSYLLVESLDRISRAQVMQALSLFTQIINAGVVIVTLADEMVYSQERLAADPMPLIMSIMVMIRAHEESLIKSKRMRQAWEGKRRNAAVMKLTRTCPSWLELSNDRKSYRLVPEKVVVVRRILQMHRDGLGQAKIARILNAEGVRPIQTRVPTESWHSSTIQKLVTSPALFGAYQPTVGLKGRKRAPTAELIEDYYPALITRDEYLTLRTARSSRALHGRGAKGTEFTNLFSGLLKCGYCGSGMNVSAHSRRGEGPSRYLVCSRAKRGLGCHFLSWPYLDCERLVLAFCRGIDFGRLLDAEGGAATGTDIERAQVIRARRQEIEQRIARLLEAIEGASEPPNSAFQRIRTLEDELGLVNRQIEERDSMAAAQLESTRSAESVKEGVVRLFSEMGTAEGAHRYQLRARLASEIRRLFAEIELFPGGYVMESHEWDAFVDGLTPAEIKREGLEELKRPDKMKRFALLHSVNGRQFPTYNKRETRLDGRSEFAALEALGVEY